MGMLDDEVDDVHFSEASRPGGRVARSEDAQARAIAARIRKALIGKGIARVAAELNVSHTTVSRMQQPTEDGRPSEIDRFADFLAAIGLKVVANDEWTTDPQIFKSLKTLAQLALSGDTSALEPGDE